jgi:hypothetical protein
LKPIAKLAASRTTTNMPDGICTVVHLKVMTVPTPLEQNSLRRDVAAADCQQR